MSTVLDLASVFRRAAEVIEENGHHKGWFYDQTLAYSNRVLPQASPVCAVGALRVAVDCLPDAENGAGADPAGAAVVFLAPRIYSNVTDTDPVERIADWNDAAGRTPGEVVAALLAAAADAEAVAA